MQTPKKKPVWAICFSVALLACSVFVLLDAFVIPRPVTSVQAAAQAAQDEAEDTAQSQAESQTEDTPAPEAATVTATSYTSDEVQITLETVREYDTTLYIADITLADPSYLKTALAQDTYGRNIKETTSAMAAQNDAILAINGDYYGSRDAGYVIRNGQLYRSVSGGGEALVIDAAGDFSIIMEGEASAEDLIAAGMQQVLSFGPALVIGGEVAVDADDEVSKAKSSNPRTAIGQVGEGHYIIIVSDGRSDESEGLTLQQLAQVMADQGVQTAYNLDGGGSSTLVFNGEVVNNPAGGRGGESERSVSDIVYIAG